MSAFIGLLALKEALGQSGEAVDTVDDGVLTSLIHRSSAIVDNYLASIRPGWVGISAGSNTGGSSNTVYSRRRRPRGHVASTSIVTNGSVTLSRELTRMTSRPLGSRVIWNSSPDR